LTVARNAEMKDNDQLLGVCPQLVSITNVAQLPNPNNCIYEARHSASPKPEKRRERGEMNFQNV